MTKRTSTPMPGNNGSWFLDLVTAPTQVIPPAPPPPPAPVPQPIVPSPVVATSAGDATVSASVARGAVATIPHPSSTTTTHEAVGRMWSDTNVQPIPTGVPVRTQTPFEDWVPEQLSKTITSRRNFRWPIIIIGLLVGALLASTLVALPALSNRAADTRAVEYRDALTDLRTRLPGVQETLALVTDLSTDVAGQGGASIAGLAGAADDAGMLAASGLPTTFPLVPRAPINALQPHREVLGLAASDAVALADRLENVYRYRTVSEHMTDLPALPTAADASTINELSVQMATILADGTGALSELPADGALGEHRSRLGEVMARLSVWQVEYLDALRREDGEAAAILIDETRSWSRQLESALAAGLGAVRTELDRDLVQLAGDIDDALARLSA